MNRNIALILLFFAASAQACRYTVREIGFGPVGSGMYQLYIPVEKDFPQEQLVRMQKTVQAALLDANIEAHVVQKGALDTLFLLRGYEAPEKNVILVSARGAILAQPFSVTPQHYNQELWDILEWACISSLREKINVTLVNSYCVVLLIPGQDKTANAAVAHMAKNSMAEIEKIMPSLPKPISHPPVLLEMASAQIADERLLLWGLETAAVMQQNPRVAILYGRCRRLGPVLQNGQLTEQNMLNLMALVGADCECGLDRSWILGSMLPTRWGSTRQQAVTTELGFDVENPAVRMEMEQILAVNGSSATGNAKSVDVLAGYREGLATLMDDPSASGQAMEAEQGAKPTSGKRIFIITFGNLALVLIVAAAIGYWKLKKKKWHD
jgi:hypothetical protein